jgi:hypothetical protein
MNNSFHLARTERPTLPTALDDLGITRDQSIKSSVLRERPGGRDRCQRLSKTGGLGADRRETRLCAVAVIVLLHGSLYSKTYTVLGSTGLYGVEPVSPMSLKIQKNPTVSNPIQTALEGLQNLYASVRFRPAPPILSTTYAACRFRPPLILGNLWASRQDFLLNRHF